jgi:hypothetical protein
MEPTKHRTQTGRLSAAASPHEHDDLPGAITEAKRLAREHPDSEFLVFSSVASAVYAPVRVTMLAETPDIDYDLPF